jgi:hypothetical protein
MEPVVKKSKRVIETGKSRLQPNEETRKAIEAPRRGELTGVSSVEELFASLNADDSR